MDDWDYRYGQEQPALGHSGPGVAAFIIALVAGALVFLAIVIAGIVEASDPGGIEGSALAVILGAMLLFAVMACLCGAALAIGGLAQEKRNKVFAVIGLVFNGLILFGAGLIVLVALLTG